MIDDISNTTKMAGALKSAGMANPTSLAAAGTLSVISKVADKRRAERQAKADAENARRTKLMGAMSKLGEGIGSIGMA